MNLKKIIAVVLIGAQIKLKHNTDLPELILFSMVYALTNNIRMDFVMDRFNLIFFNHSLNKLKSTVRLGYIQKLYFLCFFTPVLHLFTVLSPQ